MGTDLLISLGTPRVHPAPLLLGVHRAAECPTLRASHSKALPGNGSLWRMQRIWDHTSPPPPPLWHPRLHSLSLTPSTLVALLITPVASQPLLGPLLPPAGLMASPVSQHLSGIQQAVPEARALSSDWAGVGMRATPPCAPLEKPAALTTHAPCGGPGGRQQSSCIGPEGCSFLDNGRQRKEAELGADSGLVRF